MWALTRASLHPEPVIIGKRVRPRQLVSADMSGLNNVGHTCQLTGSHVAGSFPNGKESETPSTSRIIATPARTHLSGGCFVLS